MKLLFDTHAFLWWDSEPDDLPVQILALCQDPRNIILLSVVSVWEMQIKLQLGKLKLNMPLADLVDTQQRTNNIEILNIKLEHIYALEELPDHHRDPFDRLLVAQALVESAILLSSDPIINKYPVQVTW